VLVVLFAFAGPAPAWAIPVADANCRNALGTQAQRLAAVVARMEVRCHARRLHATLPATIDCADPQSWPADGFSEGLDRILLARDVARTQTDAACGIDSDPAALGYHACRAPCDGISIITYADVASCVACRIDALARSLMTAAYGTPPLPIQAPARRCQNLIGLALKAYLKGRIKRQVMCQYRKDIETPTYANVDCSNIDDAPGYPDLVRLTLSKARVDARVARCANVNLAVELDNCGGDVAALQACIKAAVEAAASGLFSDVYLPAPVPTPTPATPSPTPSPDCGSTPCPDLAPGGITPFFPTPVGGCTQDINQIQTTYRLDVCTDNLGDADAGTFHVDVDGFDVYVVNGLAAHTSQCDRRPYRQTGTILVDSMNEVSETNEANNQTGFYVAVPSFPPTCQPTPTPTPVQINTPTCAPTGTPPYTPTCGSGQVVTCNPILDLCIGPCGPCPTVRAQCPAVACSGSCPCCTCVTPTPPPSPTPT
jgi:hypothetical protein